jgi:hypothetical protein
MVYLIRTVPEDFDAELLSLASHHTDVVLFPGYLSALYKSLVGMPK